MKFQKKMGGSVLAVATSTALLALTVAAGSTPAGAGQIAKSAHATTGLPSIWYINPLTAYPLFNDSAAVFKAAARSPFRGRTCFPRGRVTAASLLVDLVCSCRTTSKLSAFWQIPQ